MNASKWINALLILNGLVGLYVGIGLVSFPAELQAQSNIILGDNPSHFSEARAPGMAILAASVLAFIGAIRKNWRFTALFVMTLFFLSYGTGRLLSLALDGMPAEGLFYAMIGELLLGLLSLLALRKARAMG